MQTRAIPSQGYSYLDSSTLRLEKAKIKPLQSESIFKHILSILKDAELFSVTEIESEIEVKDLTTTAATEITTSSKSNIIHRHSVNSNGDVIAALFASDTTVLVRT